MNNSSSMITGEHLKYLRNVGLSDETIKEAGFYSAGAASIFDLLDRSSLPGVMSGLVIPYTGHPLHTRAPFFSVKPDYEPGFSREKPAYLRTRRHGNWLYIPPASKEALQQTSTPVYITYCEEKALLLAQAGLCAVAVAGPWGWSYLSDGPSSTWGQLLDDFYDYDFGGRTIFIICDPDTEADESKNKAVRIFAEALECLGAAVVPVILNSPDEVKLDTPIDAPEFLHRYGKQVFLKHCEQVKLCSKNQDDETDPPLPLRLINISKIVACLFHDESGRGYAQMHIDGSLKILDLDGELFRNFIINLSQACGGEKASADDLNAAVVGLMAHARFKGPTRKVRFTEFGKVLEEAV